MMILGAYRFSIETAAYQELSRTVQYRWARQERIGTNDALQFTGPGPETLALRGSVFPFYKGGLEQVDQLRLQASIGLPLPLVDGRGRVWGLWCVEEISEVQTVFEQSGAPRRQDFDMRLTRYDGGLRALLPF